MSSFGRIVIHTGNGLATSRTCSGIRPSSSEQTSHWVVTPPNWSSKNTAQVKRLESDVKAFTERPGGPGEYGAATAESFGGYHTSRTDKRPHALVKYFDKQGNAIIWKRLSDGTIWDRIHIAEDRHEWDKYVLASKEDASAHKAVQKMVLAGAGRKRRARPGERG